MEEISKIDANEIDIGQILYDVRTGSRDFVSPKKGVCL
jgi:hypothetical protein